jgi:hypothetical protein
MVQSILHTSLMLIIYISTIYIHANIGLIEILIANYGGLVAGVAQSV